MSGVIQGPTYSTFTRGVSLAELRAGEYVRAASFDGGRVEVIAVLRCKSCAQTFSIGAGIIGAEGDVLAHVSCAHCDFGGLLKLMGWR